MIWLALILLATSLVYIKVLTNDFTYDDKVYAAAYTEWGPNTMVVDDHDIGEYFSRPMGYSISPGGRGFRPMTVLSYAAMHRLSRARIDPPRRHPKFPFQMVKQEWQDPAWPQHLLNLLLHLSGTFLVYLLVRNFTRSSWPALAATAVFGLHALHSDPICSIVGRGELLPFVFGSAGLLLYVRALARGSVTRWLHLAAAMLCLQLAFLSKESAVAWFIFVPLYTLCLHVKNGEAWRSSGQRQLLPCLLAVLLPTLIFVGLYLRFLNLIPKAQGFEVSYLYNQLYHQDLVVRVPTAVMVWGYGLFKVCAPFSLACDYGWRVFENVGYGDWRFWLAALTLMGILYGGLRCFRSCPLLFLGMAAFLGFSFITSNLPVTIETIFGERLFYTPVLGLSFLVAALIVRWPKQTTLFLVMWLVASSALCIERSFDWQDDDTLLSADGKNQPRSVSVLMGMARSCRTQTPPDWPKRERYLKRILEIDDQSFTARNELAADMMTQGKYSEARELLNRAMEKIRETSETRNSELEIRAHGESLLFNLAGCLHHLGEHAEARKRYQEILDIGKTVNKSAVGKMARIRLMWLAWQQGDAKRVERLLADAEAVFGEGSLLAVQRALLSWSKGDHAKAANMLRQSLSRVAQSEYMLFAWDAMVDSYSRSGQRQRAVAAMAQQAALLVKLGMSDRASQVVQKALESGRPPLALLKIHIWLGWEAQDRAAVEQRLKDALTLAPTDAELLLHTGIMAMADGNATEAVQILGPVMARFPASREYLRAWLALVKALVQQGNSEGAAKVIQDVCRRNRMMPMRYAASFLALDRIIRQESRN